MNYEVRSTYRSFRRVQEFLAAHNYADAQAGLGKHANELKEVVDQLSAQSLDQEAGFRLTKAQTKHQRELRQQLWQQHMQPIAAVARDVFGIHGMDKALKMPKMASPHERIVSAAGAMAEAAEKQLAAFVEQGMDPSFVSQLRSAAAELAQALGARDGNQRRRLEATRKVKELVKRGRRAVRLLNAILRPKLAQDPSLLSAWDSVRKVKNEGGGVVVAAPEATVGSIAA